MSDGLLAVCYRQKTKRVAVWDTYKKILSRAFREQLENANRKKNNLSLARN